MTKKVLIFISFLTAIFLSSTTMAEDGVVADPEHYTVEFENDKIRIIRIKYGPGEKSVMHTHGPNAATDQIWSGRKVRYAYAWPERGGFSDLKCCSLYHA